jgi:hypothetical protein
MAAISEKDKSGAQQIFTEIWNYYKKYYNPERNDQYWDDLITDGIVIIDKHKSQMVADMIIAIQEELHRRDAI